LKFEQLLEWKKWIRIRLFIFNWIMGNLIQLNNIYMVNGPMDEMWFLLNPVDPKISCDVLGKLIHSNNFKVIYHAFQSDHKEIIDFEKSQDA